MGGSQRCPACSWLFPVTALRISPLPWNSWTLPSQEVSLLFFLPCSLAKEDQGTHLKEEGDEKLDGGGEKQVRRFGAALGLGEQLQMEKAPPYVTLGRGIRPCNCEVSFYCCDTHYDQK